MGGHCLHRVTLLDRQGLQDRFRGGLGLIWSAVQDLGAGNVGPVMYSWRLSKLSPSIPNCRTGVATRRSSIYSQPDP